MAGEEVRNPGEVEMVMINERVRDKSRVRCYKCGEFGHYSNECPKWEKEEAGLIEEEPSVF